MGRIGKESTNAPLVFRFYSLAFHNLHSQPADPEKLASSCRALRPSPSSKDSREETLGRKGRRKALYPEGSEEGSEEG